LSPETWLTAGKDPAEAARIAQRAAGNSPHDLALAADDAAEFLARTAPADYLYRAKQPSTDVLEPDGPTVSDEDVHTSADLR
jgi:hypothetical protein